MAKVIVTALALSALLATGCQTLGFMSSEEAPATSSTKPPKVAPAKPTTSTPKYEHAPDTTGAEVLTTKHAGAGLSADEYQGNLITDASGPISMETDPNAVRSGVALSSNLELAPGTINAQLGAADPYSSVTEIGPDYLKVSAPKQQLHGIDLDLNDMPDAAMTLVPMALFTDSPIAIRNIASWRVKETDRIAALATEMRKLGCAVEEGPDYIVVDGNTEQCRALLADPNFIPAFDTYNDHRMAMSLSLVALKHPVIIKDYRCCAKTFPDYFERLAALAQA